MWLTLADRVADHPFLTTAILTVLFEVVAAAGRLCCDIRVTRDTKALGLWTGGWRIHHGYVGMAVALSAVAVPQAIQCLCLSLGGALVLSDLIHHFAVLWPVTGSPEFHLRYPARSSVDPDVP